MAVNTCEMWSNEIKITKKFDVLRCRLLGNHYGLSSSAKSLVQLGNNFVREAEGCRWELKARNSAVQLCGIKIAFFPKTHKNRLAAGGSLSQTPVCDTGTFKYTSLFNTSFKLDICIF